MEQHSSAENLAVVHALTLSVLSLFSPEQNIEQVLNEIASKLELPALILWKKQGADFRVLSLSGLARTSRKKAKTSLKSPAEVLALNLPELRVISDHWCFPLQGQSPYFLQLLFQKAPGPSLQNTLQKLGETLHKALTHRELQAQNEELVTRLQAVLNASPDGVVFLDHLGKVRSANPRSEDLLGCELEETTDFFAVLKAHPRLQHMLKRWLSQSSPAGSHWEWEPQNCVLDVRCVPVPLGKKFFYTLYFRDVTETQRTAKKLKETKARLETIMAHLQLGIFLENREGKVLLMNPALQEMFPEVKGREQGEFPAQLLHQEIATHLQQPEQYLKASSALQHEKTIFTGKVYACNNGHFVEHDAIPILFDQLLTGHLWVFRDVTEKVLAEADKRRLAQFPEKNPNPVLQLSGKGQVLYANTPARYLLSSWYTDLHGYVPEALYLELARAKQSGQTLLTDVPFGRRSFQILVVYFAEADLYHLYATDITSLRQAEQNAIAMRDHAINASAAKSEFLAVMSHEIRTPLNAVLGMLELLNQQSLTPSQMGYVESARGAGDNLLTLINHILDFARLESGRLELHPQPFLLRPLLEQCVSVFRYKAEEKGIELSYDLDPEVQRGFLGDAQRIRQVLFILVDNALKFTAQGYVRAHVSREEDLIWVSVEDTGVGLTQEQQGIIFERFRQADSSITREYGGSGLGLSIAQELVSLHGGTISVKSKPGQGSCFRFSLALPEADVIPTEREHQDYLSPEDYRQAWTDRWPRRVVLLIVEDAPENRALIEAYLEGYPFILHFAHNGHAGIQAWKQHHPDLVLMDMQMPVLDGLSATRAIHQLSTLKPRIVALTADASEQAEQAALEAGCLQILTKPLSQRTLFAALDELITDAVFEQRIQSVSQDQERFTHFDTPEGSDAAPFRFLPQLTPIYPVFFNSRLKDMERFDFMLKRQQLDWELLERSGHSLKGAGASFGFPLLSTLGSAIEQEARVRNLEEVKRLYRQMQDYVAEVKPQIDALIKENAASDAMDT